MNKIIKLLFLSLLISSCASKKGFIYESKNEGPITIKAKSAFIKYIDTRKVDSGDIQIPVMSFPNDHLEHEKVVSQTTLMAYIENTFKFDKSSRKDEVEIFFHIQKAKQIFHANVFSEEERIKTKTIFQLGKCEETIEKESMKKSIDASIENINEMLYKQLKLSFKSGLKKCVSKNE